MNKLLSILSIFAILMFFAACGGEETPQDQEEGTQQEEMQDGMDDENMEEGMEDGMEDSGDAEGEEGGETTKNAATGLTGSGTWTGDVVSVNEVVLGKDGKVSAAQAQSLAGKGQPIGFMTGGKVYMVINSDGSFAGAKLAKKAGSNVEITGTAKTKGGVNYIIADLIK